MPKNRFEAGLIDTDKRVEDALNGNPEVMVGSRDPKVMEQLQQAAPVIQTTVVNSPATVGVNVMLPEEYHLRLTMYNKKNRRGGIKNIATEVVMKWIDEHCN